MSYLEVFEMLTGVASWSY